MRVDVLFPLAIASHEIDPLLADSVEQIFLERLSNMPRCATHYGDFFLERKVIDLEHDVPELYEEILTCKNAYYQTTGLDTTPGEVEFWTQDYSDEGLYHRRHHHGTNGISGIYWIRANEHAPNITFYSPNIQSSYARYSMDTSFSWSNYSYTPKKGTILLFPSYLEHEVGISVKETVRSTIAFNFPLILERKKK